MPFTPYEEDMNRAHYFALGALHGVLGVENLKWEVPFELAVGFSYYYPGHMEVGLWRAWDQYTSLLQQFNG